MTMPGSVLDRKQCFWDEKPAHVADYVVIFQQLHASTFIISSTMTWYRLALYVLLYIYGPFRSFYTYILYHLLQLCVLLSYCYGGS